jgi:hypothetical protein
MPFRRWKKEWDENWQALKASKPGKRFQDARHRQREADKTRSALVRWLRPIFAVVALAVGVILVFIPGPAFVFIGLSAALFASESQTVARALDRTELWLRRMWSKLRKGSGSGHAGSGKQVAR